MQHKDNINYNYISDNFPNEFSIENAKPLDVFKLYFTDDILDYITE